MMPRAFSQRVELLGRAIVGRLGDVGARARSRARRSARRGWRSRYPPSLVPTLPMCGKGEGDDLAGIGRIGQDLLIAGHRRVEADLADGGAGRAEADARDHGAVGQHEARRRRRIGPGCGRVRRLASACSVMASGTRVCRGQGGLPRQGGIARELCDAPREVNRGAGCNAGASAPTALSRARRRLASARRTLYGHQTQETMLRERSTTT